MRTLAEIDQDIERLNIERDAVAHEHDYKPAARIEVRWARDKVISDLACKIEDLRTWMKRVFVYAGMGLALWLAVMLLAVSHSSTSAPRPDLSVVAPTDLAP